MAKPTQLAHVVFQTRRFDEMLNWYQTALEVDIRFKQDLLAFLSFDSEHHRIALVNLSIADPEDKAKLSAGRGTVEHVSFTYASLNVLLENYTRLKDLNIEPYWCIHHGMTLSMYYGDPDGNQLEFQIDIYDTAEAGNEFLNSEAFAKNPIGVEFDPQDMIDKKAKGVSEDVLLEYKEGPVKFPLPNASNR